VNGLLKAALIGGGAYLLYESGILSSLTGGAIPSPVSSATPASVSTTPSNPNSPSPTNPNSPPPATPTWTLVLQKAISSNPGIQQPVMLTFYQWNYYYTQVTGLPGPAPDSLPSFNANQLLQVSQWWAGVQTLKPGITCLGILAFRPRRSGFGMYQPASLCSPQEPINGMRPPAGLLPAPGCSTDSGMGRWIY